jgi:hypothetical protein
MVPLSPAHLLLVVQWDSLLTLVAGFGSRTGPSVMAGVAPTRHAPRKVNAYLAKASKFVSGHEGKERGEGFNSAVQSWRRERRGGETDAEGRRAGAPGQIRFPSSQAIGRGQEEQGG